MKRHDSLIPLTHDHHHALAQARRLKAAAKGSDEDRLRQAREFLDFFESDTLVHFREEEEVVFPLAVDDVRAAALIGRVVLQHVQIHALVARLAAEVEAGRVTAETEGAVAGALEKHIRLEEREVFPVIQEVVPDGELTEIALSARNRS